MRRGFHCAAAVLVATAASLLPSRALSSAASNTGERTSLVESPLATGAGLELDFINGAPYGIYAPIHVLTFSPSQYTVQVALANHALDGGLQTPSAMCQSTPGCVAAINGDYFDVTDAGQPAMGDEVGGIIRNCVLLHTPEISHEQVDLSDETVSEGLNWTSDLDVDGTDVPITAINQQLPMTYVRVHVPLAGTLLYTSLYDLPTPAASGRVTYEFEEIDGATSPTTINATADLEFVGQTTRPARVARGDVDISAPVGTVLASLGVGDTAELTVTSTAGCNNIGGHPILFEDGEAGLPNRDDTYMATPYPRTVIGWTATGETLILSVGGSDGETGATMFQLLTLLYSLDAVTALDLDGGGSTSLYVNGRVVYPTAATERPVSTGLLIVSDP